MFAVYRVDSDGCSYSSDTVLFVTANEQTAKDAVVLAELEREAAALIKRPKWTLEDVKRNGAQYYTSLLGEYSKKLAGIFTVDTSENPSTYVDPNVSYYYEKIEVR